ncbi:MAG: PilZ domain-containing protein [bacterium]|nr:PilZ domain-containing protein [bacterium]
MSDEDKRKKPRIGVRFRTQYDVKRSVGSGLVMDISETGALIEGADPMLIPGGRVRLKFSFYDDSLPVEVGAIVVRTTENGFGVKFSGLDQRHRALLAMAISKLRSSESSEDAEGVPGAEDDDDDHGVTLMSIRGPTKKKT